jgi:branched-chain amino acid transport system ATP-binding protein
MSLLQVEGLTKTFGGVAAVAALDFTITAGKIHSIIGPNGAGKTTLFNLINGVYAPSAGRIVFRDADITALSPAARAKRGIARTFQNLQIFFNMTAIENVMVGRHLHVDTRFLPSFLGLPSARRSTRAARAAAEALMDDVGLAAWRDAAADAMPYGALKRLEIARALAAEPSLLLLDEPAAGLNPTETHEIDRLIQRIAARGVTVILVEHDMKLVMGVSDHILVLDHGRKLAEGSAQEVRRNNEVITAYLGAEMTS